MASILMAAAIPTLLASSAVGQIATPESWEINRSDPRPHSVRLTIGETVTLLPRFVESDGMPVDLTGATVTFRRSYAGVNDLTCQGYLSDPTNGIAAVVIDSAAGYQTGKYTYEITVASSSSQMVRAYGPVTVLPDIRFGSDPIVLGTGTADAMAVPYARVVDRQNPVAWIMQAKRGETLAIRPTFVDDDTPVDLEHAYTAYLRYRDTGSTNAYAIPCSFTDRSGGTLEALWTPANELSGSLYVWDIIVSGATSSFVRCSGSLTLRDSIGYVSPSNTPTLLNILDMATVQIVNVGYAPWLSSYEIDDVRRYIQGLEDGSAALEVASLSVGGVDIEPGALGSSLTNLSVIGYGSLTRTGPHTATINILGDGGGSGVGGGIGSYTNTQINGVNHTNSVRIGDGNGVSWAVGTDGVWRATASTPNTWSVTGAVSWVVDGVEIGRVDSNGITMLKGSLQLYEDDLNANLRIYDGSRTSPSLTPYGHPNTIGMYVRGYMGSYGFGFSHAGTDIMTINASGITMLSTNATVAGRIVGDLSSCSNYPEPLFMAFATNMVYPGFTIQTNGTLSMQRLPWGYNGIVLTASNSTAAFFDINQTRRVNVDGDLGKVTLRDAGGTLMWEAASADSFFSGIRTQYTRNAGNTAAVTNIITYKYGMVTSFTQ